MKYCIVIGVILLAGFGYVFSEKAVEKQFPLGHKVAPFTLKDFRGKSHRLGDFHEQLVVIAFLGTECPLARLYGPRLEELKATYATRGVAFLAINANLQDSVTELAAYA